MKLLLENWRLYEQQVLEEGFFGDLGDALKKGFQKLMGAPQEFDQMTEKAIAAFETIFLGKLEALAESENMQRAGEEVADKINASLSQTGLNEKMKEGLRFSVSELRKMGVGPETIELIGASVTGAAAESVVEAAEQVVGDDLTPEIKNILIRIFSNFIGSFIFGFIDNFVMVIAGSWIDTKIATAMGGIGGPMLAAGFGNTVSDVIGKLAEKSIEGALNKIGINTDSVSDEEMQNTNTFWRFLDKSSGVFGIALGCLVGLFPLLLEEQNETIT
jgi:hypothetical protein